MEKNKSWTPPVSPGPPTPGRPGQGRSTRVSVSDRLNVKYEAPAPDKPEFPKTGKNSKDTEYNRGRSTGVSVNQRLNIKAQAEVKIPAPDKPELPMAGENFKDTEDNRPYKPRDKSRKIYRSLEVNGVVYSSYPEEFSNEKEAYQRAALVAIESNQRAQKLQQLPVFKISDEEFIDHLYHELLKFPRGFMGHKLEEWYGKSFEHRPPSHWYDLVQKSHKIRVEHNLGSFILFANHPGSS